jgi:excinuclease ABC subunit A
MQHGKGIMMVIEKDVDIPRFFSRQLMCPSTGISYNEPAPHSFSFNSPHGACSKCNGLGTINEIDMSKIIPDQSISIKRGAIKALGPYKNSLIFWQLESLANKYNFSLSDPVKEIPEEALDKILYGTEESLKLSNTPLGSSSNYFLSFDGIINYIQNSSRNGNGKSENKWTNQFIKKVVCPKCEGQRLKKESLHFRIHDKNIAELANMDIISLNKWFSNIEESMNAKQQLIARDILKEIRNRLGFLLDVGLTYLALNRPARSLSGGESQRIRLATQIGSQLVNVLYILDEPSIGLHQRDNMKLIHSLQQLRDNGNSILVVEHDRDMIESADYIVDMGPFAGRHGGQVVAAGNPVEIKKIESLTTDYLHHRKSIPVPSLRRKGNGNYLVLKGAMGNNLKSVNLSFPLGKFICVTGVSGSGKSTLINETLHPILSQLFYRSQKEPLQYKKLEGSEHIDKVIEVDQSPSAELHDLIRQHIQVFLAI